MRILVLSFYYSPDLCAGSFRMSALVEAITNEIGEADSVDVLTTQPNRYDSYKPDAMDEERKNNCTIKRIRLPFCRKGVVSHVRQFCFFAFYANKISKKNDYDLVVTTSARLMTALLAMWIAKKQKAKLYVDIRDIFVDTLKSVYPSKLLYPITKIFSLLETLVINKADKANLVSQGFKSYFFRHNMQREFSTYSNGVDELFIEEVKRSLAPKNESRNSPLKIVYAGNVGDGQGLHHIIPELAMKLGKTVFFQIIGGGSKLDLLRHVLAEKHILNVQLIAPVLRSDLVAYYQQADILFLHLSDMDSSLRVLPSKIFEYAATGKPIVAGVSGYAAEFITREVENVVIFNSGDAVSAVTAIGKLSLQHFDRTDFINKFSRKKIMADMAKEILGLIKHG